VHTGHPSYVSVQPSISRCKTCLLTCYWCMTAFAEARLVPLEGKEFCLRSSGNGMFSGVSSEREQDTFLGLKGVECEGV